MGIRDVLGLKTSRERELENTVEKLKQVNMLKGATTRDDGDGLRPATDLVGEGVPRVPEYPIELEQLEKISKRSDVLGSVLQTLRSELFKEGVGVEPRFKRWCPEGHEVEEDQVMCPEHGEHAREPNRDELDAVYEGEVTIGSVNDNGQSLKQVLKQFENDLNVFDNGYLFLITRYLLHPETGEVVMRRVREVVRGDPKKVLIVADGRGNPARNDNGEVLLFCPRHRSRLVTVDEEEYCVGGHSCGKCGAELLEAFYAVSESEQLGFELMPGSGGMGEGTLFYSGFEVLHASKYEPSLTYGYPQTIKVFDKALTLMHEDDFLRKNFGDDAPPRKLLSIVTEADESSVMKVWESVKARAREVATSINPFVTPDKDASIEVLDLMKSLDELQFTQHRKEFRDVISATFNVMPIFTGEGDTTPFTDSPSVQNLITEKAVREGVNTYNEDVLPVLSERVWGLDDHKVVVEQPDVTGEQDRLGLLKDKMDTARRALEIGMDVEWRDGEFVFREPESGLGIQQTGIDGDDEVVSGGDDGVSRGVSRGSGKKKPR